MKMKKIGFTGEVVELKWETSPSDEATEQHELTSKASPDQAFKKALQKFAPLLRTMLGFSDVYALTIRSISIRHNDEGRRSIIVSGTHPVEASNSPFNVNTPLVREIEDQGSGFQVVEDIFRALDKLEKASAGYIKALTDQLDMLEEEPAT